MAVKPGIIWKTCLAGAIVGASLGLACVYGQTPQVPPSGEALPQIVNLDAAVSWALRYNPELAVQRQQRGIAAAKVLIANTYPFNPILENRIQGAAGPVSAGITNSVPLEHLILWEMEVRGQGKLRRQGAAAGLSRTDWEIARQEQLLIARVLAAFSTWLYRDEKLRLFVETQSFNDQLVEDVRGLMKAGKLHANDLILAQTEAEAVRDLVESAREARVAARYDVFRVLGIVGGTFQLQGTLAVPPLALTAQAMQETALQSRGDLLARQAAIAEAEANLRLARANRFGNPTVGPVYVLDPSRVSAIGIQLNVPLPVATLHRGDIAQRDAERTLAVLDLRQTETLVRQDVQSAAARLAAAQTRAEIYRTRILPGLRKADEDMEQLFRAGAPGVDVLRVLDVRRRLLTARDSYLDTLWRVTQVRAELVAAVGVLGLPGWNPVLGRP
jgi:outer membrane protein TolC